VSDKHYFQSLHRSIIATVLLVSIMPLLLLVIIVAYRFDVSYKDKTLAHLQELVLKHQQNINSFLDEKLSEVKVLSEVMHFGGEQDQQRLQKLHQALSYAHQRSFVDLGLVNSSGVLKAYAGPFKLGNANYHKADWFKAVMEKDAYISDLFLGLRGVPHFIIAVKFQGGSSPWILRATIDFVEFCRLVEDISVGRTGRAFIVNREGEYQTSSRAGLSKNAPFLPTTVSSGKGGDNKRPQVKVSQAVDPSSGAEVIFITAPLKFGEWTLVFRQDAEDAFKDLSQTIRMMTMIMLVGIGAITMMALILSRRILRRIKQADQSKEMMNEQVIEAGKLASVGELAAGIAHEINNPVAIMMEEAGWIQDLLDEGLEVDENMRETQQSLKQIHTQGTRCKEITHKLLSFARKIDPMVKSVALNELVREITALSRERARFANVRIEASLASGLPNIEASPSELQQVLLNLINNAIDAMEKEGGDLIVSTRLDGDNVLLSVEDSGMGIPKANLARLFDPFFTTKPVGKGTGLGLSIIYGIINKMGGEITVNSTVDVGTAFNIRIPQMKEENRTGETDAN